MRGWAFSAVAVAAVASLPSTALSYPGAGSNPSTWMICSRSGRFCAESNARTAETTVYWIDGAGNRNAMWRVDGWHRVLDLADDGERMVVGSDSFGLVPANYDPDDAVLRIFRRGHLEHAVPLRAILRDPFDLLRAGAWFDWGSYRGFDGDGATYVLERVDGTHVRIDVSSGRLL